jgi:hypothetical protein
MAKAQITLPDGVTVTVTGTPDEITAVVSRLQVGPRATPEPASKATNESPTPKRSRSATGRVQITDLIEQLLQSGFFKKPKDLGAVKTALQEIGHHYPATTLSPTLLRQVRKRNLRRLKQDSRWVYTG